ncbi:hypothetical protein OG749_44800 [Streptomyces nojiriensis]|uniref:hypothetical protein n=1 Tax=Streptomyces nojiriensis TaxID=66374 RepID=UPI002E192DD7
MAAGILHPDGRCARPEEESCRDRDCRAPALMETRFGLSRPRGVPEDEPLPAFVIA